MNEVASIVIKYHTVNLNMKNIFICRRMILLLIVFMMSVAGFSTSDLEKPSSKRIKNFGQIDENYYRGGQPKANEFSALKELGIKTVIDLRKDALPREIAWVQSTGMRYFNIPLSTTRPATKEQTDKFLKLVNEPAYWPVYVHCAAGRHRTGAMTAIYRIARYSWTPDMAYNEMKRYGFYSFPNHGSLKQFVYQYVQSFSGIERKNQSDLPVVPSLTPFLTIGAD
jgi:protein tyrosine/serine phosphatase